MGNLGGIVLVGLVLGGLLYFWQKARLHGLSVGLIFAAFVFWPAGAIVGLYWAAKDFYFHHQ